MIRLLIYEDNPQFRDGLTILLNGTPGFEVLAGFKNCNAVVDEVEAFNPDVVLMDIDMPGTNGLEGLRRIRKVNSGVKVLMLTVFDDNSHLLEALQDGANGYVLKKTKPAKLLEYIEEAHTGGGPMSSSIASQVLAMFSKTEKRHYESFNLSEREREVLLQLVNGLSYKMIGAEIGISIDTVRSHIKNIYEKMHVNSKAEAMMKAIKNKLF